MRVLVRNVTISRLLAALSLLLCAREMADGQIDVSTKPVGFTSVIVNAGKVAALSLPLNNPPDYHGVVSALTSHTVQTSFAGWGVNAYGPFAAKPHIVRMLSGAATGRQYKIQSNTADTLTLSGSDLTAALAVGDEYQIIPLPTLQSLFGATAPALLTNSDPTLADNVLLRGDFGWLTYYNDGTQWLREGAASIAQNTVALPLEAGLLLVRRSSSALDFLLIGNAPTTDLKTDLSADRVTFLGNRFPLQLKLSQLKLTNIAGWLANADSNAANKVLIRGSFGWLTYYYDGHHWLRQGGSAEDPVIGLGTAVLVARGVGMDVTLDQPVTY